MMILIALSSAAMAFAVMTIWYSRKIVRDMGSAMDRATEVVKHSTRLLNELTEFGKRLQAENTLLKAQLEVARKQGAEAAKRAMGMDGPGTSPSFPEVPR